MFSKRALAAAGSAPASASVSVGETLSRALTNPLVSAGGAGVLCLALIALLIGILGDAGAGSPRVEMALGQALAGAATPAGWREALTAEPEGEAHIDTETVELSVGPPEAPPESLGSATITLPAGAKAAVGQALSPAPVMALTAPGPGGSLLPTIAADGRAPFSTYARPFTPDGRPRVGLVVGGLGLDAALTNRAIATLPPEVTLSFYAMTDKLQSWIDQARAAGHEVLLEAPMQPAQFPDSDAGPYALSPADSVQDLTAKLEWTLSRATGYFGVVNYQGSGFLAAPGPTATFAANLKKRGLAFIDDGQAVARAAQVAGVPRGVTQFVIDDDVSTAGVQGRLAAIENAARSGGQALGAGIAYRVTIDQAAAWANGLSARGFQLAPASALMKR